MPALFSKNMFLTRTVLKPWFIQPITLLHRPFCLSIFRSEEKFPALAPRGFSKVQSPSRRLEVCKNHKLDSSWCKVQAVNAHRRQSRQNFFVITKIDILIGQILLFSTILKRTDVGVDTAKWRSLDVSLCEGNAIIVKLATSVKATHPCDLCFSIPISKVARLISMLSTCKGNKGRFWWSMIDLIL